MCIPSCIWKWFTTSDKKPVRKAISQQTRMQIAFRQNYICPRCKQTLSSAWDVDHIVRLADNGTNSHCNLQVICTSCHRIKTAKENTKNKKNTKKVCQEQICSARNQGYRCAICHKRLPSVWKDHQRGVVCPPCKHKAESRSYQRLLNQTNNKKRSNLKRGC